MDGEVALSPSEQAYFESSGATEVVEAPAASAPDTAAPVAPVTQDAPAADAPLADRDEKGRFVPHQALHAEREEHKKTKAALDEISRKQAVLEDRWNTILKLKEPEQAPIDDTPPDPNEDIFAFSKWQADKIKALTEKVEGREKQEEQQRTISRQESELWNHWSESATSYAQEKTDFGDAVKFLSDMRTKQLTALAAVEPSFASEQGRMNQINAELRQIVAGARQIGQNPAEIVYQVAASFGYAPTAPAPGADPGKLELPEKLAQIDAAQNASRTLATPGGRSATDPLTPEAIASMSTAEFEAWIKSPDNAKRFESMMGG
jgi:hypothetical protein